MFLLNKANKFELYLYIYFFIKINKIISKKGIKKLYLIIYTKSLYFQLIISRFYTNLK